MVMMRAAVFVEPGRIELQDKPIPEIGPNDALLRITTTTICGTDVHILKGEYPVAPGLTIGHEPVGIIEKLGANVQGYREGQRVIAGAICPSFTSRQDCSTMLRCAGTRGALGPRPRAASAEQNAIAIPSAPARAVRPIRCT